MLCLTGVDKSFTDPKRGVVHALTDVSVTFTDGITAVVGPNGSGKTTLLRIAATLLAPDAGSLTLDEQAVDRQTTSLIRNRLGYLSTAASLYDRLTVAEQIVFHAGFYDLTEAQRAERLAQALSHFDLDSIRDARCGGLSTGQRQRVKLAQALIADPDLVILDEPTTGLDIVAATSTTALIQQMRRPGRSILLATHIVSEIDELADRLIVLRDGAIIADTIPHDLQADLGTPSLSQALADLIAGTSSS